MAESSSLIRYLKKDELIKSGSIIFVASIITGFFNYIYQVYMGRMLGPEEYGTFGALFAIFYIFGVFSSTLGTSTTRFVSKFIGEGKQIGFFIKKSVKMMIIFGLMVAIIFLILDNYLMGILKISDHGSIQILALILFFVCIEPIMSGTIRGIKLFSKLGIINIINSLSKLIFGVLFVLAGFGVGGALAGVIFGVVISLIISVIFVKPYIKPNNPHDPEFNYKSFYLYSFPVLIAMIGYSIPSNLDVILAKYLFNGVEAGLYTSVSVLGKIIFFFPGAIGTVMFPIIAEKYAKGEDTRNLLKKSLVYTGLLSGSLAIGYILFPGLVVNIFGEKYIGAVGLVGYYGMAMFFFSLVGIITSYHLAIKNMRYIVLFTGFTGIEIILLMIFHSSVIEMIQILAIVNLLLAIVSIVYTFRYKEITKQRNDMATI